MKPAVTKIKRTGSLAISSFAYVALASCAAGSKKASEIDPSFVTPTAPADTPPAAETPTTGSKPSIAYKISVKESGGSVRTQGSGVNECVDITATVLDGDKPAAEVEVTFRAVASDSQKDFGEASPKEVTTNASGVATSKYCSGKEPGIVTVQATAGASSANSGEIKATAVPSYRFSWKNSKSKSFAQQARDLQGDPEKLSELLATDNEDVDKADPINFTLRGSGNDCGTIEFELTRDGFPASGQQIKFQTQVDYPIGVKLAKREDTGSKETEASSGKTYAFAIVTSNVDGVFQVPFCSGPVPGTVVISGVFTEAEGRVFEAKSPILVMSGGLSNYGFMSLSFDPKNSRVIPADTFTNTQQTLPFVAQLGTIASGSIIKTNPLSVLAEIGRVIVDGNGVPDDAGTVKFTYEILNTRGKRPFMTFPTLPDLSFDTNTGYSACEPLRFTSTASGGPGPTPYSDLAMNWRSTLIYSMRGSEYASRKVDSSLDPNTVSADEFDSSAAFGFWDVNQNGVFDGSLNGATIEAVNAISTNIDKLTHVPANRTPASFDPIKDDWFLDLPSPFVDANENGRYDVGEPIVGDKYLNANGRYDTDTTIWKSLVLPVYLGATAYSLQHSLISSTISSFAPSAGWQSYHAWISSLNGAGYGSSIPNNDTDREDRLFGHGSAVATSSSSFNQFERALYFHAQDKCGNPIPGGRKISTTYTATSPAAIGKREVTTHFYTQPYDGLRESSKRLLAVATGSSETTMNFDVLEHPASKASYPIQLVVRVAPCENYCTGDLLPSVANDPPRYCSAEAGHVALSIEGDIGLTHLVSIAEVYEDRPGSVDANNKCGCAVGATRSGATCSCPSGTSLVDDTCIVPL